MILTKTRFEVRRVEAEIEIHWRPGVVEKRRELIMEQAYDKPTVNVGMTLGVTKNMGNYNNVKFSVSLYMPCYAGEENDIFGYVKQWLEDKVGSIDAEIDAANEEG